MRGEELYIVRESLRERDGKNCMKSKEKGIESGKREFHSCVSIFGINIVYALDRIGSLGPSSYTHSLQTFIVGCALGQGLTNRVWARKIVQPQLAPSVGRTRASAGTTVKHGRTRIAPGESSSG